MEDTTCAMDVYACIFNPIQVSATAIIERVEFELGGEHEDKGANYAVNEGIR